MLGFDLDQRRRGEFFVAFGLVRLRRRTGRRALIHDDLPAARNFVVTQQVSGVPLTAQLEVAVTGRQPLVEHLDDLNGALAEVKAARCLLAPMTRVTLDLYRYFGVRISVGLDLLLDSPRRAQARGKRLVGRAYTATLGASP